MKKNPIVYNDEIDLIALFKIILNSKIKILLITIISFLIGIGYSYQLPNDYLISLTISKNNNSEFKNLDLINRLIIESKNPYYAKGSSYAIESKKNDTNQIILNKFFNELQDHEEFLLSLRNVKKVKEKIISLPLKAQEKELFKYKKLLNIVKGNDLILNIKWKNIDEAKDILQNTINLTSNNLKNLIYTELNSKLEYEKKIIANKDLKRLEFLKGQSWIAKELNYSDNQIVSLNSLPSSSSKGVAYYLMGYKVIDKEIELIENRDHQKFELIIEEINSLKKKNVDWINYDIHSSKVASLKNTKLILIISILLGLIFGTFYVVIYDAFKSKIASKIKTSSK